MRVEVVLARGGHVGGEDHAVVKLVCAAESGGAEGRSLELEEGRSREREVS